MRVNGSNRSVCPKDVIAYMVTTLGKIKRVFHAHVRAHVLYMYVRDLLTKNYYLIYINQYKITTLDQTEPLGRLMNRTIKSIKLRINAIIPIAILGVS